MKGVCLNLTAQQPSNSLLNGRRHGRVVREPDLKSGGRGFKSRSDHLAGVVSR